MSIVRSLKVTLLRVVRGDAGTGEAEEKRSWKGLARRVPKAIFVIVVAIVAVKGMGYLGWFRGFEDWHLNTLVRLWGHPKFSKDVAIVEINEQDYLDRFDGRSPLDKKKLLYLIAAVLKYHPAAIGVDIDTSDWFAVCQRHPDREPARCAKEYAELDQMLGELRTEAKKRGTVIVWAAVPRTSQPPLEIKPALGGLALDQDFERLGIPQFPVDRDGSVRHFDGRVEVEKSSDGKCPSPDQDHADQEHMKCYMPTFARAIYEAHIRQAPEAKQPKEIWFGNLHRWYCRVVPPQVDKCDEGEPVIFNFHGDRYQFPIIDAKQFPEEVQPETQTQEITSANTAIENRRKMEFGNQVVLIGGSFPEARDEYFTPMGAMQGVELNALAIQTDLDGGGIPEVTRLLEIPIDIVVGFYIVGIFYRFEEHPWKAVRRSAAVIPLAFVFSLLLFRTPAYWFNFIPVAAGVFLHQLCELAEGGTEAREKLRELRREQGRVEVGVTTVEELAVAGIAEAGPVDPMVENTKVKGAASGAG